MAQTQRNMVGAILLIALGVLFLAGQVLGVSIWSLMGISWPLFVLLPGLVFLALAIFGDRRLTGFVFPGAIVTGTGAILWYQNVTNHWESWAYMWALYPVFLGLALMFNGRRSANEREVQTGRGFFNFGMIGFIAGAAFFEIAIFGNYSPLAGWVVPVLLIGAGGYLLLTGRLNSGKRKTDDPVFTGARVIGKRESGRLSPSDELRRQIDEALAEDDPRELEPRQ